MTDNENLRERYTEALAKVEAVLPDECWVTHSSEVRCMSFIGVVQVAASSVMFTEEMACLPCRVYAALASVPAVDAGDREPASLTIESDWNAVCLKCRRRTRPDSIVTGMGPCPDCDPEPASEVRP